MADYLKQSVIPSSRKQNIELVTMGNIFTFPSTFKLGTIVQCSTVGKGFVCSLRDPRLGHAVQNISAEGKWMSSRSASSIHRVVFIDGSYSIEDYHYGGIWRGGG